MSRVLPELTRILMIIQKLLPNEAFLKHMCATYGGDVQNGNCYSYAVDEKATTTNCPDGYSEYYFEHMKYCMKAVCRLFIF
uniref:Chitin-binding type-2 domain-containing protein n=1 Tax=Ascaris lumbricoides TaxID=6252 RepID=A0A0M3HI85_ASCLU